MPEDRKIMKVRKENPILCTKIQKYPATEPKYHTPTMKGNTGEDLSEA